MAHWDGMASLLARRQLFHPRPYLARLRVFRSYSINLARIRFNRSLYRASESISSRFSVLLSYQRPAAAAPFYLCFCSTAVSRQMDLASSARRNSPSESMLSESAFFRHQYITPTVMSAAKPLM